MNPKVLGIFIIGMVALVAVGVLWESSQEKDPQDSVLYVDVRAMSFDFDEGDKVFLYSNGDYVTSAYLDSRCTADFRFVYKFPLDETEKDFEIRVECNSKSVTQTVTIKPGETNRISLQF